MRARFTLDGEIQWRHTLQISILPREGGGVGEARVRLMPLRLRPGSASVHREDRRSTACKHVGLVRKADDTSSRAGEERQMEAGTYGEARSNCCADDGQGKKSSEGPDPRTVSLDVHQLSPAPDLACPCLQVSLAPCARIVAAGNRGGEIDEHKVSGWCRMMCSRGCCGR